MGLRAVTELLERLGTALMGTSSHLDNIEHAASKAATALAPVIGTTRNDVLDSQRQTNDAVQAYRAKLAEDAQQSRDASRRFLSGGRDPSEFDWEAAARLGLTSASLGGGGGGGESPPGTTSATVSGGSGGRGGGADFRSGGVGNEGSPGQGINGIIPLASAPLPGGGKALVAAVDTTNDLLRGLIRQVARGDGGAGLRRERLV